MKTLTRWAAVGLVGLLLIGPVWGEEVYRPVVPIVQVAHVGEPVPGVGGATFYYFYPPRIDAAGNVLLVAWMVGPGIDYSNDGGLWYGPPGAIELVARKGDQAPGMAPGVVYVEVSVLPVVSETGLIAFGAYVAGPGIVAYENDGVVYCGYPGEFEKVFQTGEAVPEIGPDVYVDGTDTFGALLSDNGTLSIGAGICGPGLDPLARAYWVGPPDNLELVIWHGMPAPGCPTCDPAVILELASWIAFNDAGQMAFNGRMSGPGITSFNSAARFLGSPGEWEMLHRENDPVPEFGERVKIRSATGLMYALNAYGDKVSRIRLYGPGITEANDWVLLAGEPEPLEVVVRDGDPAPEAQTGTHIQAAAAGGMVNNRHEIVYLVGFGDDGPDLYSGYGLYFGPYANPALIMESDDPAPYFGSGQVFRSVNCSGGYITLNDVGDVVTYSQAGPAEVTEGLADVLWLWHDVVRHWVPLVWSGLEVEGRTVTADASGNLGHYWSLTGGADGRPQSFNDRRQLAILLDFTDGTMGVYRVGPPLLGDIDGDGEVTAVELAAFGDCVTGPGGALSAGCEALDLSLDGVIDLVDFRMLQLLVGETR